jgi:hypothetical protein
VPLIEELDDELVTDGFFHAKKQYAMSLQEPVKQGMINLSFYQKFKQMGVHEDTLKVLNQAEIDEIDKEENEEMLLVTTIKNQTPEKKA